MPAAEALERQLQAIRQLRRRIELAHFDDTLVFRGVTREQVTEDAASDLQLLQQARPMFWTKETTDTAAAIGATLNLHDIMASRDLLYFDHAFCWFDVPWIEITMSLPAPALNRSPRVYRIHGLNWSFVDTVDKEGKHTYGIEICG